ncbi:response regulator [Sulfidibacter corallicola]|uniref:histidine kinase n=1 Tax=Sulfidibacter corallicola TaxID=2818388 RepID=A0A8A4TQ04_SULCO|nr:ATP-binding protein [Sulfidibacter corallicola]QTD48645.1 response regulator [Sulfidibacter corallicola]
MFQDAYGYIWIGTWDGLNVFDGLSFKVYRQDLDDPTSISDNSINVIAGSRNGDLWVGTRSGGLNRFHQQSKRFTRFEPNSEDPRSLPDESVFAVLEDSQGRVWVGTEQAGLYRLLPSGDGFEAIHATPPGGPDLSRAYINELLEDSRGRIWVGSNEGLLYFEPGRERLVPFQAQVPLPRRRVEGLIEDRDQKIWFGTCRNGLMRIDPQTGALDRFLLDESDPDYVEGNCVREILQTRDGDIWAATRGGINRLILDDLRLVSYRFDARIPESISSNQGSSILEDETGIIWYGSLDRGINKFNPRTEVFGHFKSGTDTRHSLGGDQVRSIFLDRSDRLWVGLGGDGLDRIDRRTGVVHHYRHDPENPKTLSSDLVEVVYGTRDGKIWVGTQDGLNRLDPETEEIKRYISFLNDRSTLGIPFVVALLEDAAGRLWVGTYGKGLDLLDRETDRFTHYWHDPQDSTTIVGQLVTDLREQDDRYLWVGTGQGLSRMDRDHGTFENWRHEAGNPRSLSHNFVMALCQTRHGILWVGTNRGLNRYHPESDDFTVYNERSGMVNSSVYGILEDLQGMLWMSTNKGLARLDPRSNTFSTYTYEHGLQANEFHMGSFYGASDGELFFGGINGFTAFYPHRIQDDREPPRVALSEFTLANRDVPLSRPANPTPLDVPIGFAKSITLTHRDNVIGFGFSALHFADPKKNRFRYKLDGFDADWVTTSGQRPFATYTNLDSGKYLFRLKAANLDGYWSEEEHQLRLVVRPPPWRSWWAYTLYVLAGSAALGAVLQAQRHKLRLERRVVERLKQVDALKDEFLANTSHELRTPLNGIIGLAESLRDGIAGPMTKEADYNLGMIVASGRRLASLVNDILDFAKLRNRTLELNLTRVDLHTLCDVVIHLSRPLVEGRELVLENRVDQSLFALADENRVLQILHNLVGNGVKFTESGRVWLDADVRDDMVCVEVGDTGIGIAPEKYGKIFNSFEQLDATTARAYGGTGLGLTVSKELVTIHKGDIWVESEPGKGSRFFFTLPLWREGEVSAARSKISKVLEGPLPTNPEKATRRSTGSKHRAHILIVDDEVVNRRVLSNHLSLRGFVLDEAGGGLEALRMIEEIGTFDLVLLDVMMPRMSGYKVCEEIRKTRGPHQLPVIFLTAKNRVGDLMSGFASGGNDYLTKPILKQELLARVETQLDLRHFNRSLEEKVAMRTAELRVANEELETLDKIVRTVNRQVHVRDLSQSLLEQAIDLIDPADQGFILVLEEEAKQFRCEAAHGCELTGRYVAGEDIERLLLPWIGGSDRNGDIIHLGGEVLTQQNLVFPAARSRLVMAMPYGGPMGAFLILDNPSREDAFRDTDIHMLSRFREHVISAMTKAKMIRDLAESRRKLVDAAHMAGMAEIAVNVVHNVGNSLNSVSTSAQMLSELVGQDRYLGILQRVVALLEEAEGDWNHFFEQDAKGKMVPEALGLVDRGLREYREKLEQEVTLLTRHIKDIQGFLNDQQRYAKPDLPYAETAHLEDLIAEALAGEFYLFRELGLEIERDLERLPPIRLNPSKMRRVLLCLLRNAWEALAVVDHDRKWIRVRSAREGDAVRISIRDNGVGVAAEHQDRVFGQGYTTKPEGMGFGLHYCANAVAEMSGTIELRSDGAGCGTEVSILLPLEPDGVVEPG